jgi:lipopolysaccharide transport system permease protein
VKGTQAPTQVEIEHVIEPSRSFYFDWPELWRYRELFYFFSWRDIKIKYKQTALGIVWVVLQPFLMMIVLTFFFSRALKVPSENVPYPVFAFSGLLIWNCFASGLTAASASMVSNSAIIKKVYFPKLIIPVSSIIVALFDFLIAFLMFVALLLVYRQPVSMHAAWCWPLAALLGAIATLGPGSWIAALNVKYRDFRYVVPFVVQVLFFLTPVIYPVSMLTKGWMQYAVAASPVYAAIEIFRFPVTGVMPDLQLVGISLSSAFLLMIIGLTYFRRTEDFFADIA